MCGLLGIIEPHGNTVPLEKIKQSLTLLRHRGPDDEGYVLVNFDTGECEERGGGDTVHPLEPKYKNILARPRFPAQIILGHRRLSILDLTPAGHQPMSDDDKKIWIIHNGEVYNYRELRNELQALGYRFKTRTDTEVILNAYQEWNIDGVNKFNGMWAFCIVDLNKKIMILSRDRFGIKPLYFYAGNGCFAFASEIKVLLELDFVQRSADPRLVYQYLTYGTLETPDQTLFQHITELKPGHNLIYHYQGDNFKLTQYYDLPHQVERSDVQDAQVQPISAYKTYFEDSINLHLRADVPIGSCLSGGIDSSAIVAYSAPKVTGYSFNTFTAAYEEKNIDESYFARLVSSHFGNIRAFYTFPLAKNFWQDFDRFTWYQDLPVNSTSMFAQWEVMKLAAHHNMKVLLDGQGADESLCGYSFFAGVFLVALLKRARILSLIANAKKLNKNRSINALREMARALYYTLPEVLKKMAHGGKRIGGKFISNQFKGDLQTGSTVEKIGTNLRESCFLSIAYGLHELLRYEDRNSMAFSIESRVPFLDHRLVEYTLFLADEWKFNDGWSKYILRKAAVPYLPPEVVWRKGKKGFLTPQKTWKQELNSSIMKYLRDFDFPKILNKEYALYYCSRNIADTTHLSEFWRMVSFLKWLEIYDVRL